MSTWQIRKANPVTRKKIRLYAIQHELSTAEALDQLVEIALTK